MIRHLATGLVVAVTGVSLVGDGRASSPDPSRAAEKLVGRYRALTPKTSTFAASKVITRGSTRWLAIGASLGGAPYLGGGPEPTTVRVFRWAGSEWELAGTVRGALGPAQWINPASVTGSRDPDFAVQGCGAGDTNCLSIVSDIGGSWHAVPFEYGYGTSLEVNGVPAGHLVDTEVDACGCAGGPTTITYERYVAGLFRPTDPPARHAPACDAGALASVAYGWQVQVLQFDRVACEAGWALAVGTGTGFSGTVVGLFDRGWRPSQWSLLTLDNGNALPVAPAVYDLPLSLLLRLAHRVGAALAPQVAAAKLIARLQASEHFYWPQQNGIVEAGGARWLIAELPERRPRGGSAFPVVAVVYRWQRGTWVEQARVPRPRHGLNVDWAGGWFRSVPAASPGAVAFELVGACCTTTGVQVNENAHSTGVITNSGGTWHVGATRR